MACWALCVAMDAIRTRERWRSRLPHWEVEGRWHFVTIRCHGSLPREVRLRLYEIHQSLAAIEAHAEAFRQLQRRYFLITEKYLDGGGGLAVFNQARPCALCIGALLAMEREGWWVGEATVMPNHVHLLIRRQASDYSLREILQRFKGRSARWVNQELKRTGRLWQQDWFDRWMRNEAELRKTIAYIRNNPVKARIVDQWQAYPWRISSELEL